MAAARTTTKRGIPPKNDKEAHFRIATESPTWKEVLVYLRHVAAKSRAVLEDTAAPMVDIRAAQGDVRTIRGLLKVAYPDEKQIEAAVPELYASGGPD